MDYQKLNEFRFARDISIILTARETKNSIQSIIQMQVGQLPEYQSNDAAEIFQEYISLRNSLFSKEGFLFPTDENKLYLPSKFRQNFKKILSKAGIANFPHGPDKLTDSQIEKLLKMRFLIQRPIYQVYLAAALLGYQALRPNEVAKLRKNDVSFEEETILLRETKSREDQYIIIYPNLLEPLRKYLRYIGDNDPLFVRESNQQWDRKDVYRAIKNFGKHYGLKNITPRIFRVTVSNYMIDSSIPIKYVSKYLRHKDVATTLRHYMGAAGINDSRIASKFLHSLLTGQEVSLNEFVFRENLIPHKVREY